MPLKNLHVVDAGGSVDEVPDQDDVPFSDGATHLCAAWSIEQRSPSLDVGVAEEPSPRKAERLEVVNEVLTQETLHLQRLTPATLLGSLGCAGVGEAASSSHRDHSSCKNSVPTLPGAERQSTDGSHRARRLCFTLCPALYFTWRPLTATSLHRPDRLSPGSFSTAALTLRRAPHP